MAHRGGERGVAIIEKLATFFGEEEKSRKVVNYGSQNITDSAHFNNDETWPMMTNSENSNIYNAFFESFNTMRDRIKEFFKIPTSK